MSIKTYIYPPAPPTTLPLGAATSANQVLEIAALNAINADTTALTAVDYATSAKQDTSNASLASIDSKLSSPVAVTGPLTDTQLRASSVPVSGPLTDTQLRASAVPVSAASLPLPTGAATESTLVSVLGAISAQIDIANSIWTDDSGAYYVRLQESSGGVITVVFQDPTGAPATPGAGLRPASTASIEIVQSLYNAIAAGTGYSIGDLISNALVINVDTPTPSVLSSIWFNVTTASAIAAPNPADLVQVTQNIIVSASALPTGASTSALQTTANSSLSSIDSKLTSPLAVTGTFYQATQPVSGPLTDTQLRATPVPVSGTVSTGGLTDTQLRATPVPVSGTVSTGGLTDTQLRASAVVVDGSAVTQPVSAAALPLPTGASTAAHQVTGNAALASIDSKLTSPLAVTGTFFQATQPVSIASSVAVTGPLTDTQLRATPVPISGSITATNSANGNTGSAVPAAATQVAGSDGTNLRAIKVSATGVVSVDGSAVTQPVSGTVTANAGSGTFAVSAAALPLPSGAATAANQATEIASLASIDTKLTSPLAVTGPLTDTQLRATPVPISGSITATNPSVSATGSAVPASATMIGGSDGTNLKAVKVSATGVVSVDGSAVTQPVSIAGSVAVTGPLTDTQLRASAVPVSMASTTITGSVAVTGPLTDTQLRASAVPVSMTSTTITGTVAATQSGTWTVQPGNTANTTAWKVDGSAVTQPVSLATNPAEAGRTAVTFIRNDYTSTSVTTAAYVQLVASTGSAVNKIEIFDSSGETLKIAFGAAASEVDQFLVFPGGQGAININIPASTRVSIKAVSNTASVGEIDINFYS